MIDKTDAGGDSYFLETNSLGKLTNLLDTRPLAVARCLDHGRDLGDAANLRIAVRIHLCRAIPGTTFSRFTDDPTEGDDQNYDSVICTVCAQLHFSPLGPLGIAAFAFVFPRQFIKRRLVASGLVAILWHVEFFALVIFDVDTMLGSRAVPFSINAARFHRGRI